MNLKQKYGSTALVAGASEGIGAAFATRLAAEGMDLVLLARRLQPLKQLADLLENKYNVNVRCISCDLSGTNATELIEKTLDGREINAGLQGSGNRLASFIMQKILPRKMAINIMGDTTRKMYRF
jgi:short-subunit dehydrogenase